MIYLVFAFAAIILTGFSQLLLKIGTRYNKTPLSIYVNPSSIAGYCLFLVVTICGVLALKGLDLKLLYALTSLNYGVTVVLSRVFLHESLDRKKIVAVSIILGIIVFNISF
jgi:multidrug transporter EmrE-like cation transporter